MNNFSVLFTVGCFSVTGYNLCFFAGLLASIVLTIFLTRKKMDFSAASSFLLTVMVSAWLGARIVYVATQLPTILADPDYYGVPFILHPWEGGYTLYGAVIGGALGGMIYCRVKGRKPGDCLNAIVPGCALTLCALRIGEVFTSQGMGHMVEEEFLQRFPFAVMSAFEEWRQPVFIYEASAAFIIMIVLLIYGRKERKTCQPWEVFLTLLGLTQVLFESLREDEIIRFGFVRFTQIAAISVVAAVLIVHVVRSVREDGFRLNHILRIAALAVTVIVCIGIEFALDKSSISNHLLYGIMAGVLTMLGFAGLFEWKT